MNEEVNWETLNAYVDGELSSQEAAEVANAVARDPHLAEHVAMLTSLKAAVANAIPPREREVAYRPTVVRRVIPWAAMVAALTFIALLLVVLDWNNRMASPGSRIELAESMHQDWLMSRQQETRTHQGQLLKTRLDELRLDAYIPDLSPVQLAYSGVRRVPAQGGEGLHVGYLGPSGCTVSLVIFPSRGVLAESLTRGVHDEQPIHYWRAGTSDFYLLASQMDPQRLTQVATVLYRITQNRLPLDPQSMLALHKARATSRPCIT